LNQAGLVPPRRLGREGVHAADVVLNILARQREPPAPLTILTPDALRLRHEPLADCWQHTSAVAAPACCSLNVPMICSSLNLLRFLRPSFAGADSTETWRQFRGARRDVGRAREMQPSIVEICSAS
jgi:hypothetical protein